MAVQNKYAVIKDKICDLYEKHEGRYGYRRIKVELCNALKVVINHKVVQRLMQELGLTSLVRIKRYQSYKGTTGEMAPNVLQRQFDADKPNQKWVTDVTEFKIKNSQKLYLSTIMDLSNREIVAWQMTQRPVLLLVTDMLEKALARLNRLKSRSCIRIKAGTINMPVIGKCWQIVVSCKACPGKATAWTMRQWKASSAS